MRSGAFNWTDEGTTPPTHLGLRDLTIDATAIALPFVQPLQFGGLASVAPGAGAMSGKPEGAARFSFQGSANDQIASVTATVADLPLAAAGSYLAEFMTPALIGNLNAEFGLNWKASAGPAQSAELLLQARQLTLDSVALTQGKTNLASIKKLQVAQAQVDLDRQTVAVGTLCASQPKVAVGRGADGLWMFESWLKTAKAGVRPLIGAGERRPPATTGRAQPAGGAGQGGGGPDSRACL